MKIGVIGLKDAWSSEELAAAVKAKTGEAYLIEMDEVKVDLEAGSMTYRDIDMTSFDALMMKKIDKSYSPDNLDRLELLTYLESKGVKIFSSPTKIIKILDRLSCTVRLRMGGIPMPHTVITEDLKQAADTVRAFGKAVLKPLYTSKARGMMVMEDNRDLEEALLEYKQSGNPVFYIQKMIKSLDKDLGVVFLGGRYLTTYARVKTTGAWNTTTRSGGKYELHEPSAESKALAQKAQDLFGLDFTCVDIAETDEGPKVFEVSAFGGFKGIKESSGLNAAELYVDYVIGKIK